MLGVFVYKSDLSRSKSLQLHEFMTKFPGASKYADALRFLFVSLSFSPLVVHDKFSRRHLAAQFPKSTTDLREFRMDGA